MAISLLVLLAMQPDPAMLRRLYEDAFARHRTAQAARDLGLFLRSEGRTEAARAALAEAVRLDEKEAGAAAPQTLADVAELASLFPPADAAPLWRRASASSNAFVAARALAALGDIASNAGDEAGAVRLYRQALASEEKVAGRDAAGVAVRLNALAVLLPPREGIPLLQRALSINRKTSGDRHPETATTNANLAGLLLAAGRVDEAVRAAAGALAVFEETLGPDHPRVASAATVLAHCVRAAGDKPRAERLYRRALSIDDAAYGPRHPETLTDVRNLAGFLRETGRTREAAALEKRLGGAP